MAHQKNFCICKLQFSSRLAFPWTSLLYLIRHYVGRTRLFRMLRRMNTQVTLGVLSGGVQLQWTRAINTTCLNRNTQHLPHLYGFSVQHTREAQACLNVSECLYAFHRACTHTLTRLSPRNPSTPSHGNYPISLFFSFK